MYICTEPDWLCISFNFEFDKVLKQLAAVIVDGKDSCVYPSILNSIKF